tara:strand:- start:80 stop:481 length:402 start_codon:yes stop_codon:yes gene_type:complete
MKIGIVGSNTYENKRKIKQTVFDLTKKFGDRLIVVSGGGQHGADKYAKKYALELGCEYREVNPAHTQKTLYSIMSENWYNKPYKTKNYFTRNTILARYVDYLIAFIPRGEESKGTEYTIFEARKFRKKVVIIH